MQQALRLLLFLFTLSPSLLRSQIVINEVSGANRNTNADDYGQFSDWLELYNAGGAAVDIGGYFLSDNPANPLKWQIPAATNIAAGGSLLFWASGRDVSGGLSFHTNFKLTQTTNETVLLTDPTGVTIDSYQIIPNLEGHSRGRIPNGTGTWNVITTPTPGTLNTTGFADYASTPVFSQAPGIYAAAISVALSTTDNGFTIRYTTDGTPPTATSTVYTGPLNILATTLVRARCFSSDPAYTPGFTETNTYLIGVTHTVPIFSFSGDYDQLFNGWGGGEIISTLEYFTADGTLQFETFGESDEHGNDSWAYPQKGIDFVVRDQYGYDDKINYQIFPTKPRAEFQRIMLKAAASDNYPFTGGSGGGCHLRDAYIQSLAERAHLNVDFRTNDHCVMYVNGQYWGLYEVREKVNDPDYTDYYWNQKEEDLDFLSYWGGLNVRYGSAADWNDLYAYIMANDMAVPANYAAASARIDIASVIDYAVINTWSVNSDWINWNTMWWRGRGTPEVKWKYVLWDMDNTFNLGQNFSGWPTTGYTADPCDLEDSFTNAGPEEGHLDVFRRLFDNPEFKQRYVNRYAELINTYLNCDYAVAHLDSIINKITPEMPGHIARWGGSMAEWQTHLAFIHDQITGRCEYIENSGIINCYEVDGPHVLAFNVEPAGSGTIKFNELLIPDYPWSGSYYGGVEGDIQATPVSALYEFLYWEVFSSDLTVDSTAALNSFMITGADSIVAHFRIIETHEIVYIISPSNSGTVSVNGISPAGYPYDQIYNEAFPVSISATPAVNYEFVEYTSTYHSFTPDGLNPNAAFVVDTPDTIVAHFKPVQTWFLTVVVEPEEAGKVKINGELLNYYPRTFEYFPGQAVATEAIAADLYLFGYWETDTLTLEADSASNLNGCVVDTSDTLVAHFILKEVIPQTMYIPSGFSPNDDGLNDEFQPFHTETVTEGNVAIYNRWGETVYTSSTLDFKWDGKVNGIPMPNDIYYYVLNYFVKKDYYETLQGRISITR